MDLEKEFLDSESSRILEEEEKFNEEYLKSNPITDEDLKEFTTRVNRVQFVARLFFTKPEWSNKFLELKKFKVIKF
jgi:hypothetical protein